MGTYQARGAQAGPRVRAMFTGMASFPSVTGSAQDLRFALPRGGMEAIEADRPSRPKILPTRGPGLGLILGAAVVLLAFRG